MLTPQKKPWSWSLIPRRDQNGSGAGSGSAQGYSSPRNRETQPPAEKFANLDKDALCDKIVNLENELLEYQYNMGLLLIEKKEWTSKYEELKRDLAEVDDAFRREQAAHLMAISEVEKREESLRNALGIEKQCVLDLEKALREMRSEHAEIKFTADSKLNEAKSLVASVEQKSLEVEAKLHATDAKLAEVNRKTAEFERKTLELVAQEHTLQRERLSFTSECGMKEANLAKQREDLREWEQKLHEGEERLAEGRRLLNQREQRANENDNMWKQKQEELEDTRKQVEAANLALKGKEEDLTDRQSRLILTEKEADKMRKSLELKEKRLIELEEKLNIREKVEMEKLLNEHKTTLDTKEKEFELELEQKRKSVDQELETKAAELPKKEAELNHMEEKIRKREQALEKKTGKVKEKESELESKSKALKEREKSFKVEIKNMENERKQILSEKENLHALKTDLEKVRSDIENQQLKMREETELLKVTENERSEHARLQLELKQEIDKCRLQSELLLKEAEDLRQERLRFEKEWEELDEKGAEIKKELKDIAEQKRNFEKLKWSEEERLNKEKLETQNFVKRELEALEVARESFTATMEHERAMLDEKTQSEKTQLLNDFEMQSRELETKKEKLQEEMEYRLREMEKSFEEKKERELNDIKHLRDVAHREMEQMKVERHSLEREKEKNSANKEHLEMQHHEMRKDIDGLVDLSRKLKDQREQFIKERERFVALIENLKKCESCAELIREFEVSDLQSLNEIDNVDEHVLPRVAENYLKDDVHGASEMTNTNQSPHVGEPGSPVSGGTISWLRKCTSIFRFSPGQKIEFDADQGLNDGEPGNLVTVESQKPSLNSEIEPEISLGFADDDEEPGNLVTVESQKPSLNSEIEPDISLGFADDDEEPGNLVTVESQKPSLNSEIEPEISLGFADDSPDMENIQSDHSMGEFEAGPVPSSINDQRSQHSNATVYKHRQGRRVRSQARRARSGLANATDESQYANGDAHLNEGRLRESGAPTNGRKRYRTRASQATASGDNDEYSGHSGSVAGEGQKKRRQKVAQPVQTPGAIRYNLRTRSAAAAAAAANGNLLDPNKAKDTEIGDHRNVAEQISSSKATPSDTFEVGGAKEDIQDSNAAVAASGGGGKGDADAVKRIVAQAFSSDSPIMSRDAAVAQAVIGNTANIAEGDIVTSEEVNGTPEGTRGESNVDNKGEPLSEEEGEDDEDEVSDHRGEVSIRKKLWNFLTT